MRRYFSPEARRIRRLRREARRAYRAEWVAGERRISAWVRPIESAPIRRSRAYTAADNAALADLLARVAGGAR